MLRHENRDGPPPAVTPMATLADEGWAEQFLNRVGRAITT